MTRGAPGRRPRPPRPVRVRPARVRPVRPARARPARVRPAPSGQPARPVPVQPVTVQRAPVQPAARRPVAGARRLVAVVGGRQAAQWARGPPGHRDRGWTAELAEQEVAGGQGDRLRGSRRQLGGRGRPLGPGRASVLPSTATARRRATSGNWTSPVASSESRYSMAWGWPPSSRQARSTSCSPSDPRAGSDFASSKAPERDSGPTWWNVSGGPLVRGGRNGWRQVMSSRPRCDLQPQLAINSARAGSRTVQLPETGDTLSSKSSRTSRTGTWPRTSSRSRASR